MSLTATNSGVSISYRIVFNFHLCGFMNFVCERVCVFMCTCVTMRKRGKRQRQSREGERIVSLLSQIVLEIKELKQDDPIGLIMNFWFPTDNTFP